MQPGRRSGINPVQTTLDIGLDRLARPNIVLDYSPPVLNDDALTTDPNSYLRGKFPDWTGRILPLTS